MKRLQVKAFGPIQQADVGFADLTVLVGPPATGKTLLLRLYQAIQDAAAVAERLERHGVVETNATSPVAAYCAGYFGGGYDDLWTSNTEVVCGGRRIGPMKLVKPNASANAETTFCAPAQRSLAFQDGWPKPFTAFDGHPYAIRHFSECIRSYLEDLPAGEMLDSISWPELRMAVATSIYGSSTLELKGQGTDRRVVLQPRGSSSVLSYGSWSAGQREFTPLLLGYASLVSKSYGGSVNTVILEKPEMGLHPQAVLSMALLLLDLLARNVRVIISTHSLVVLDIVWAIRELSTVKTNASIAALCRIFNLDNPSASILDIFAAALRKEYLTYYFNCTNAGVVTEDISTLDPGDVNENIAGWGGVSGVSGRIARIVGEVVG